MISSLPLIKLLQLASPSLPVGAYSYSEGLETLCDRGLLTTASALERWLRAELDYGSINVETAVMLRVLRAATEVDTVRFWNSWYAASRETEELRGQSLQMGRSLLQLISNLEPHFSAPLAARHCHYCTAFGLAAALWHIDPQSASLGYLHSWVANLVNAGIKLIPLGQTQGQQIQANLSGAVLQTSEKVLPWTDDQLEANSWGLQLASMNHEGLYSRIFRS
ncbi:urease accessory protein UreF [Lyngbya confervoides]|uniref:Urease accessory protein UreF n=1 Tax=Lyngbya confervoides BDU141951 TaxID=1574623 RepID=A0ABD4TBH2_9CYAN|nr:urease accessory protein UreF [Lyngbya confervoides]MCM1985403.1 urease accessory protein UreF [Lyngbya confervoides BDU141951]